MKVDNYKCGGRRSLKCGGRKSYACGGRRKAWLGAAIGAASSLASGLIGSKSAKKQQEEALRQQRNQAIMQQNAQLASVYSSALAGNANLSNIDYTDNMIYRCGGRKKARSGIARRLESPYITDGGVAIPLGNGLSLLRGATHEDVNETGQTGIGINTGRGEIEAENGEVIQNTGKELRIFSDQPMFNGISPADAVQAGYSPNRVFNAQERVKSRLGIKNPTGKAPWGDNVDVQESDVTRTYTTPFNERGRRAYYADNYQGWFDPVSYLTGSVFTIADYYSTRRQGETPEEWMERQANLITGYSPNVGFRAGTSAGFRQRAATTRYANQVRGQQIRQTARYNRNQPLPQQLGETAQAKKTRLNTGKTTGYKNLKEARTGKDNTNRRDFVIQSSSPVYSAGRPGKEVLPPTNIPYEYRLTPYNNSVSNRLRSAGHNLSVKAQKLSDYLSDLSNKTGHAYRSYIVKRNLRRDAKERLARIKSNSNTSQNTNTNNNQTRWQKTKAYAKKQSKKAGIASGITIGVAAIGSAINSALTNKDINTNVNTNRQPRQQVKSQPRQQAKSRSTNQTPASTRNIKDIIKDVREATTKDYLTAEQRSLIYGPINIGNKGNNNSKKSSGNRTTRSNRNTSKRNTTSHRSLKDIVRFTAPNYIPTPTRTIVRRPQSVYDLGLTDEQIDRLKEEITQIPFRPRKRFGGRSTTTPVERIGRRKYLTGGSNIYEYTNQFLNSIAPPRIVDERPIWQRSNFSLPQVASEITGQPANYTPATSTSNNNTSPTFKVRSNNLGMDITGRDWIGLGSDILGSLGVGLFNANSLKDINVNYAIPQYVDETPVAFDTTWHNGAQRANVERNRINARNIIGRNTASANTAVQRMQQSDTDAMMQQNVLWDEKANKEAELRNTAAQNEQQVRARNAAARNAYYQQVAEIRNAEQDARNNIRLAQANALSGSLAGIGQAASNFLTSAGQRYEDNNALRAYIAGSDEGTLGRLLSAGVQINPDILAGLYNYEVGKSDSNSKESKERQNIILNNLLRNRNYRRQARRLGLI